MTYTLTLTENDFTNFQLYEASKNIEKIKSRRKGYFLLLATGIIFVFIGYFQHSNFLFYYATFCVAFIALFYYRYSRFILKRHYTKYVKNTYSGAFNESYKLEITNELLKTEDKTGISDIKLAEVTSITEISTQFFIKISTGPSLIVPKVSTSLNDEIAILIERRGIPYVSKLDWRWK